MEEQPPPPLPEALSALARGYSWRPVTLGRSGAAVYALHAGGEAAFYLKTAAPGSALELRGEAQRLRWLAGRLPVPQVLAFAQETSGAFLLTTALRGRDASNRSHRHDVGALVRALARGLRQLHALPLQACPFDHCPASELARAEARIAAGAVDEEDFDDERRGMSAEEVFRRLLAERPADEDLVFTHGDYSLPNVILHGGRLEGFIDLGRAGVGDRSRDLALAARSLAYNWGEAWVPLFFEAYGLEPDPAKLAFYRGLDEFF